MSPNSDPAKNLNSKTFIDIDGKFSELPPDIQAAIPEAPKVIIADGSKIKDATVVGDLSDELLSKPLTIAIGRNRQDMDFKNQAVSIGELFQTLSEFERGQKDGTCILQGELVAPRRMAKNVARNHVLLIDVDTGSTVPEVGTTLVDHGLAGVIWTTHSNRKATTEIAEAQFQRWLKKKGYPTPDSQTLPLQLAHYLKAEKRYHERIHSTVVYKDRVHVEGGVKYVVTHAPMTKLRVLLFLSTPFDFTAGTSQVLQIEEWKKVYVAASEWLNVPYDSSCVDPSRLMYLPRIAKGAVIGEDQHEIVIFGGKCLDLATIPAAGSIPDDEEGEEGLGSEGRQDGRRTDFQTPGLLRFAKINTDFDILGFMEATFPDDLRGQGADGDKAEYACPNEDSHTEQKADDRAFMVSTNGETWYAGCLHDGCKLASGEDRLRYLDWLCLKAGIKDASELEPWSAMAQQRQKDMEEGGIVDPLPDGFERDEIFGRIVAPKNTGTAKKPKWAMRPVCGEFNVRAMTRDAELKDWGLEIEFKDFDGKLKSLVVPYGLLAGEGAKVREFLAGEGLWMPPDAWGKEKLAVLLGNYMSTKRVTTFQKPGLYFEGTDAAVFVAPSGEAIRARNDVDAVDHESRLTALPEGPFVGGTLAGYQAAALAVFADPRLNHVGLFTLTGSAGTLIDFTGLATTGLHISGASSGGKTTGQVAAAAQWGCPEEDKCILVTTKGTTNAIEYVYERGCGTSLHFDEGANADSRTLSQMAFNYASKGGRKRLTADIKQRRTPAWTGYMTISSEKNLTAIAADAKMVRLTGAVVRLPSINIDDVERIDPTEAARIKAAFMANYGHLGPEFVRMLFRRGDHLDEGAQLRNMVSERTQKVLNGAGGGSYFRAAENLAVGDLMVEGGLFGATVTATDVERVVRWGWESFLSSPDAKPLDTEKDAVVNLLSWLQTHPGQVRRYDDPDGYQEVVAWYGDDVVYLPVVQFPKMGLPAGEKAVLKQLKADGLLLMDGMNRKWKHIPGHGKLEHYRIKLTIKSSGKTDQEEAVAEGVDPIAAAFIYPAC